ncbi:glycoside hydrolase family 65 protein [Carnobacterium maltaromaticum]|uniref:glycoside hydrolase family 65 protein n=1 Tax=Carnobacterium maltaromaticum TaxID=2751 RepID=UPI00295EDB70|nr:glycosyl hydrolase family 65 protein [Carnobacterium maltaromaticum]
MLDASTENFQIHEIGLDKETLEHNETLFTLGNGHIGTRGSLEEAFIDPYYKSNEGTYLNGFFESAPITYGEAAYGYAKNNQTICRIPNGKQLSFAIEGEWFNLNTGETTNHQRSLDLKKGLLLRSFDWKSTSGKEVHVEIERLVSYRYPEIMAIQYQITPLNFDGVIAIKNQLSQETIKNIEQGKGELEDPRVANRQEEASVKTQIYSEASIPSLIVTTNESNLRMVCSQTQTVVGELIDEYKQVSDEGLFSEWVIEANLKKSIEITSYTGYTSFYELETENRQMAFNLVAQLQQVKTMGYNRLKAEHFSTMFNFWQASDVEIQGDNQLQKGIRFNLFHLNQAAGRTGLTNIAAKGLTGDGYEGHYFWDTEMYMLPFFIYTQPETAKALLLYRYSILDKARARARELAIKKGVLFPWRTINGAECSAYYPAGTAQFHINADIAYGVERYFSATGDTDFMLTAGLEIMIETARFWVEFGSYIPAKNNQFCLNGVTGPDEYTALVNNNFYTNLMAQKNLVNAAKIYTGFSLSHPVEIEKLIEKLAITPDEFKVWQKAGEKMYLPFDEEHQLTMQDDSAFNKDVWNFNETPKEKYPLLLHFHPLTIYRYQVNKQADTVLAELLFPNEFTNEQKIRDFDYYEKITTHDSSLSRSIFGMMASEIGRSNEAYHYFMDTALMDLKDGQGNTDDGIHAANMGGSWLSLVYGFAGLKMVEGKLSFEPRVPKKWSKLAFSLFYLGSQFKVTLEGTRITFELLSGTPIEFSCNGNVIYLTKKVSL